MQLSSRFLNFEREREKERGRRTKNWRRIQSHVSCEQEGVQLQGNLIYFFEKSRPLTRFKLNILTLNSSDIGKKKMHQLFD